jgi:hypothetical protein
MITGNFFFAQALGRPVEVCVQSLAISCLEFDIVVHTNITHEHFGIAAAPFFRRTSVLPGWNPE